MWLKNVLRDDNIMVGCNGHSRALLDNAFWAIWTTSGYLFPPFQQSSKEEKMQGTIYILIYIFSIYISLNQKKIAEEQKKIRCTKLSFKLQLERY